jgi:hypothetical protein
MYYAAKPYDIVWYGYAPLFDVIKRWGIHNMLVSFMLKQTAKNGDLSALDIALINVIRTMADFTAQCSSEEIENSAKMLDVDCIEKLMQITAQTNPICQALFARIIAEKVK